VIAVHDHRLETDVGQQAEPLGTSEQARDVPVVHDLDAAVGLAQHEGVVRRDRRVVGVGVPAVLEVVGAPVVSVAAAAVGPWLEVLAQVVGREEGGATGPAVDVGGLDGGAQVLERRHVVDRVVDEDAVERPVEADRPHVALDVPAHGVELPAHLQHPG